MSGPPRDDAQAWKDVAPARLAVFRKSPRSTGVIRGGMIAATTDEYHSPWLWTYLPRIHAMAVRRSFHFGMTGLRLSNAELRVNGVKVHLPFAPRSPRNSS